MKSTELSRLFLESVLKGAATALSGTGSTNDTLSKSQAFTLYGRTNVERWIAEGLINLTKSTGKTSKQFIDRTQLERIARTSNRITYLPTAER